jgi:hypothetical protein
MAANPAYVRALERLAFMPVGAAAKYWRALADLSTDEGRE